MATIQKTTAKPAAGKIPTVSLFSKEAADARRMTNEIKALEFENAQLKRKLANLQKGG
ncbi:MAG: hypothetical protein WCK89_06070 [bacterium]